MKKLFLYTFAMLLNLICWGNDGAFYAQGNQLIPIQETDIYVQKEILTLKKVKHDYVEVNVYYEFYNPNDEKSLTVGFEAFSPYGDVDGAPKDGQHPYIQNFTVEINNKIIKHNIAYVNDTLYKDKQSIKSINLGTFEGETSGNYVDFFYVYHFKTNFKKGLNIIKHTYKYDLSGGICFNYKFDYVLTAANRWANNQIDDFTLIIDCGEFESFDIQNTFFNDFSEWDIAGIGKGKSDSNSTTFHIQTGKIIFHKINFKPKGELKVKSEYCLNGGHSDELPFSYYAKITFQDPQDEYMKKVFKNLPFARRGYIFKTKSLQTYYENTSWYQPNPNYTPDIDSLNDIEVKWINKYKK